MLTHWYTVLFFRSQLLEPYPSLGLVSAKTQDVASFSPSFSIFSTLFKPRLIISFVPNLYKVNSFNQGSTLVLSDGFSAFLSFRTSHNHRESALIKYFKKMTCNTVALITHFWLGGCYGHVKIKTSSSKPHRAGTSFNNVDTLTESAVLHLNM